MPLAGFLSSGSKTASPHSKSRESGIFSWGTRSLNARKGASWACVLVDRFGSAVLARGGRVPLECETCPARGGRLWAQNPQGPRGGPRGDGFRVFPPTRLHVLAGGPREWGALPCRGKETQGILQARGPVSTGRLRLPHGRSGTTPNAVLEATVPFRTVERGREGAFRTGGVAPRKSCPETRPRRLAELDGHAIRGFFDDLSGRLGLGFGHQPL